MLGDFQYCSSSSDSDSGDSDDSSKSEGCLDNLIQEKEKLEEQIKNLDKKMKFNLKTLRTLNEERKNLLTIQNEIISSLCVDGERNPAGSSGPIATTTSNIQYNTDTGLTNSSGFADVTNESPLELSVCRNSQPNDEEFDSDDGDVLPASN